jgi:CRISPR type IV-associated protein Csf2
LNVRLFGLFTLRSPVSHIGESLSTHSFLVEEPILHPGGKVINVAIVSGNSFRGQLRDLASLYMLQHLGNAAVPRDPFSLLFSGGRIGGGDHVDIAAARQLREAIPIVSIFGGGVDNQILLGKLRVSSAYPLCQEAIPALPDAFHDEARQVSYRALTFDRSYSRTDDTKNPNYQPYLQPVEQLLIADESGEKKKREGPATQMRFTCELLITGTRLYTEIQCLDVSEAELGCLVSALHMFSLSPHLGGKAGSGHGRVRLDYSLMDVETGEIQEFLRIGDGPALLAPPAESAKAAYDAHLKSVYDRMLAEHGGEIRALLGAA